MKTGLQTAVCDSTQEWAGLLHQQAFVNGCWVDASSNAQIEVYNPANGKVIGTIPDLNAVEVRTAVACAQHALPAWRRMLPRKRGDLILRWSELMLEQRETLAVLMTTEQGKPLADARGEIDYAASFLRWFAEEGNRCYGEVIPSHLPDRKMFVQREPLGVVGLVTPWNFPSAMLARKAGAALAAGCTAVAAPSTQTPYSALALAALAERAGVPPGVFSVVTGQPAVIVGELCRNPAIRGLSFTGSTEVGRLLMAQCAPTVKRLSLELGGHAPFIVFPDADIDEAAKACAAAKFQTGGQDCLAANRIFVHQSIYKPFVAALTRIAKTIKLGDGLESGVEIGPLINAAAVAKSELHVADALAHGARRVAGRGRSSLGELFYEPTVLVDVTPAMRIMHEETFGPVAAVAPFHDEAEVVSMANATEYGLIAYVFTKDLARAHRVSDALEYGMIAVNTAKVTGAPIPFGGVKQSGLGREGSRHGIDEYTELKYVCLAI